MRRRIPIKDTNTQIQLGNILVYIHIKFVIMLSFIQQNDTARETTFQFRKVKLISELSMTAREYF